MQTLQTEVKDQSHNDHKQDPNQGLYFEFD